MNAGEIRKCDVCGQPVSGNTREGKRLDFHRIVIEHHVLDVKSLQQRVALSLYLGSEELAGVMGALERVSVCLARRELLICGPCMVDRLVELLDLGGRGREMPADKVPA
jgi:hypothetical protein